MASTTIAKFAAELKLPVEVLLEQLRGAGVSKSGADDELSEADKQQLLLSLRKAHGSADEGAKKKITITRKQTSEIKQADATGKSRTIQVEVRKRRTFVKREDEIAAGAPAAPAPAAFVNVVDEEQQRLRAEEDERQRLLLERQAQDLRARQEQLEADRLKEEAEAALAAQRAAEAQRLAEQAAIEAAKAVQTVSVETSEKPNAMANAQTEAADAARLSDAQKAAEKSCRESG